MTSVSKNAKASHGLQALGMILLSMGLYAIVLWWAIPVALLSWPGAGSNDASFGLMILSQVLFICSGLLLLTSLFFLIQRWMLVVGMLVLSVLAAFVQRWLFPASEPYASINWILTFVGSALVLSCILLISQIRVIWPALWRTLLVTAASAVVTIAVAYICGRVAASGSGPLYGQPPESPVFKIVSLLVGSLDILIIYFWLTRKKTETSLSYE